MSNDILLPVAADPGRLSGGERTVESARPSGGERAPGAGARQTEGTHGGHLEAEARRLRVIKNARTASHGGQAERAPCSSYSACNHARHGRKP